MAVTTSDPPAVSVSGVHKRFGATAALAGVDLTVGAGTVHGLLGGNGSGKSTLVKILAGVYRADEGRIDLKGERIELKDWTPDRARDLGLRFVHQDLGLFPRLSIADNLFVDHGYPTSFGGRVDRRKVRDATLEMLRSFGVRAMPDRPLGSLRPAEQTMVAIARALRGDDASVLVLDEPTVSLPKHDVDLLFDALRAHVAAGQTIVLVSHRLDEVLSFTTDLTVLRDGEVVGCVCTADTRSEAVVELIAGRSLDRLYPEVPEPSDAEILLTVEGLHAGPLRGVDLTLRSGEILGIAGLLGSGRSELLRALFGDLRVRAGRITLDGVAVRFRGPADAVAAGVAYVSERREWDGIFSGESVTTNLGVTTIDDNWSGVRMRTGAERRQAATLVADRGIVAPSIEASIGSLSGGNQQKVVLARWLRRSPRLLLLDEPTQGVDVMARADLYEWIRTATDAGAAAIVVSSDAEELTNLCDRVLVLVDGRSVAEVPRSGLDPAVLVQLSYQEPGQGERL